MRELADAYEVRSQEQARRHAVALERAAAKVACVEEQLRQEQAARAHDDAAAAKMLEAAATQLEEEQRKYRGLYVKYRQLRAAGKAEAAAEIEKLAGVMKRHKDNTDEMAALWRGKYEAALAELKAGESLDYAQKYHEGQVENVRLRAELVRTGMERMLLCQDVQDLERALETFRGPRASCACQTEPPGVEERATQTDSLCGGAAPAPAAPRPPRALGVTRIAAEMAPEGVGVASADTSVLRAALHDPQAASDSLAHPGRNTPAAPLPTLLVAPPSPVEQRVSVQSVAGSTPHALQRTAPAAAPQTHSAPAVLSHSPLAAAQLPPLPTGPGAHPAPPKPRSATPRHASGTRAPAPSPASPTPAARVQTASPRHVEAGNLAPLQQAAPVVVADTRDAAAPRSPVRSGAAAEQAARALTPSTERSGTPSTEPDSPRAGYDEAQSSHVRAPPPSPSEGPSTRRIAPVPSPALSPLMADAPTDALQAAVSLAAGFASRASEPAGNADGEHVGDAASADDTIAQRAQSRPEDSQKAQHALAAMAGDAQPRPPDSTGKENTPAGRGAAVAGTPTARGIMSRLRTPKTVAPFQKMRVDVIGMELFKTPSGQTTEHRHLGTRLRFLLRAEDYRATSPDPWPRGLPHNGGAKPLVPVPTRVVRYVPDLEACHALIRQGLPEMYTAELEVPERDLHAFYRALEAKLDDLCDVAAADGIAIA